MIETQSVIGRMQRAVEIIGDIFGPLDVHYRFLQIRKPTYGHNNSTRHSSH